MMEEGYLVTTAVTTLPGSAHPPMSPPGMRTTEGRSGEGGASRSGRGDGIECRS